MDVDIDIDMMYYQYQYFDMLIFCPSLVTFNSSDIFAAVTIQILLTSGHWEGLYKVN